MYYIQFSSVQFISVQSLSRVRLFATPWIAACQDSLFITISRSSLRLTVHRVRDAIQPLVIAKVIAFFALLKFAICYWNTFLNKCVYTSFSWRRAWQLTPVLLPGESPWTEEPGGLQSMGLSRVFSNITVQKHQFFGTQPSSQCNSHILTWLLEKP